MAQTKFDQALTTFFDIKTQKAKLTKAYDKLRLSLIDFMNKKKIKEYKNDAFEVKLSDKDNRKPNYTKIHKKLSPTVIASISDISISKMREKLTKQEFDMYTIKEPAFTLDITKKKK